MLRTRILYLKSFKHWKEQIVKGKIDGYINVSFCPFCRDCDGNCDRCKVDREICYKPARTGTTLIHKIQDNNTNKTGLLLAR